MKEIYTKYRFALCFLSLLIHIALIFFSYHFKESKQIDELTFTIINGILAPMSLAIIAQLIQIIKEKDKSYKPGNKFYITIIYLISTLFILIHGFGCYYLINREASFPGDLAYFTRSLFFLEALIPLAISDIFRKVV